MPPLQSIRFTTPLIIALLATGPVIAQGVVPIRSGDDIDTLHARIQRIEHVLLPDVIDALASGHVRLHPELKIADADDPADETLMSLTARRKD